MPYKKCIGACDRFLKSLRRVRSKGSGDKTKYDGKTYDYRVTRGLPVNGEVEIYLRCNKYNIFLDKNLHFSDSYSRGKNHRGPPRCPCCGGQLSDRHNKK